MCAWAKELAADSKATGLRLTRYGEEYSCILNSCSPARYNSIAGPIRQSVKAGACGTTCADFRARNLAGPGGGTFGLVESELGQSEWPCPGVTDVMLLREPWTRLAHLIAPPHVGAGGDVVGLQRARGNACAHLLAHLSGDTGSAIMSRFDNLYVRMLLGLAPSPSCPLGCINASHLAAARRMLARFVVIPTTRMRMGMRRLVARVNAHSHTLRLRLPADPDLHAHRSVEGAFFAPAADLNRTGREGTEGGEGSGGGGGGGASGGGGRTGGGGGGGGGAAAFERRWATWDSAPPCIELQQKFETLNWADSALYGYALEAWLQDAEDVAEDAPPGPDALPLGVARGARLPNSPAGSCWVRFPSGCPQGDRSPPSLAWVRDAWGEGHGYRDGSAGCERRQRHLRLWCGAEDVETHFVP